MSKHTQATQQTTGRTTAPSGESVTTTPSRLDRIAEQGIAPHVAAIKALPEVREDRVAAMKKMIAEGRCDTPERLNAAIEKMLGELREH